LVENHDTFQGTISSISSAATATRATGSRATPVTSEPPSSAQATTRPPSIPTTRPCRSNSSSRRCERSSPALAAY